MTKRSKIILAAGRSFRRIIIIIIATKKEKGLLILEIHRAGIKHYNQIVFCSHLASHFLAVQAEEPLETGHLGE